MLTNIPFSHFSELIKIDDLVKRHYYEMLTIKQTFSFRELQRQISTLSFERLGLSSNKMKALAEFTLDGINEKMFVSKYAVALPTKKQLESFIKKELKKL